MKLKVVLRKNNCLAAIGDRPMEITDDKWNEVDGNTISDLHLALADEVLSSVAEKNTMKEIKILSQNCTRPSHYTTKSS